MVTNIGSMIQADQAQIVGEMNKLAASNQVLPSIDETPSTQGFTQLMSNYVKDVDNQNRLASEKMAEVDSGESDDLVGAMLMSQEASLSFSMLMQVRNKIVAAVDDIIKLQL